MKQTISASCSIAPDSRRSESIGRLSPPRVSTERDNCDKAMIGIFNSLAILFMEREMVEISCSRFPFPSPPAVINCK